MTYTWVDGAAGSAYDVDHLPYGVFSIPDEPARVGVRIGDQVLDLAPVAANATLHHAGVFNETSLNDFMALGPDTWAQTREWLTSLLTDPAEQDLVEPHLIPLETVSMSLPFAVADYVDFYCSRQHAENVGQIFRPDDAALPKIWLHQPIGYHGRSSTVVVSGTPVPRPVGPRPAGPDEPPGHGPSLRLDIEAELGFVVGAPSDGAVATADFDRHVFGVVLLNDWSARDLQAWEYVPLGPFNGKAFATSISAWVTPLAALEQARCDLPEQAEPMPYLRVDRGGYDIELEVVLNGEVVSRPPYASLHWGPAQMLAHLTVTGAGVRTGDLFGSGTISGDEREQRGSFLELSWGGREPFSGDHTFLRDGDEVSLRASARTAGGWLDLGEVTGRIQPARG